MSVSAQSQSDIPHAAVPVGFQANIDVEGNFTRMPGIIGDRGYTNVFDYGGVSLGGGAGVRFRRFLYAGAAFNFMGNWGATTMVDWNAPKYGTINTSSWVAPIYADLRLYLPTASGCFPYWEMGIGGYVGIWAETKYDLRMWGHDIITNKVTPSGGFFLTSGIGVEFKYLNIGVGYKYFSAAEECFYKHFGFIRLGVSLGQSSKVR